MNLRHAFALFLVLSLSCEKEENGLTDQLTMLTPLESHEGLTCEQSLAKWHELKERNGTSYRYQATFTSWNGTGHTTELKIEYGAVTERVYQAFKIKGDGSKEIIDFYTEDASNLGAHQKGADVVTMDNLYDMCAITYLAADHANNSIYFESSIEGILTVCGYVPNGCIDDCFNGIRVTGFEWINK